MDNNLKLISCTGTSGIFF